MDKLFKVFGLALLVTLSSTNGKEEGAVKLNKITDDFWEWRVKDRPDLSTRVGEERYNDRLEDMRWEMFEERKNAVQDFLNRLHDIDRCKLDHADKINYDIFKDSLKTYFDGYKWRFYGALNPLNFLEGIYTDPISFVEGTPFKNWGNFVNYLSRLKKMPEQLNQMKDRHRKAIQLGHTYNNVSVNAVLDEISVLLKSNPIHSAFYEPFNDTLDEMTSIPQSKKDQLRQDAKSTITTLLSAFNSVKTFLIDEYMPHTRTFYGVKNWVIDGETNYEACLKWHLSLDMTPEEVHQKGLEEVDRISKEMKKIMEKNGFKGTIKEYFEKLNRDPKNHRYSGEELLDIYRELITKITAKIPQMFNNYPNLPIRVMPMMSDGPGGSYGTGSDDGSRPGTFYANVIRPEETPVFDMPALTLHEAVPGHHLQESYALTAGLPKFRKKTSDDQYYAVPFNFPFYTAFAEGWALYSEALGEELGVYEDDIELMGRYGSEIFRACRLVVDTGLHHYGWSRERAIEYMLNYTAYSRKSNEVEIDRYITWPGQACGYKIGELKIKELRKKATEQLGDLFNIKDFHGVIVDNGAMPLTVMEDLVNTWIDTTKSKASQQKETDQNGGTGGASTLKRISAEFLVYVTFGTFVSFLVHPFLFNW